MPVPFNPKFVDLVRTATTTTGVGPLVPGAASPGFASFALACIAGDQFYYCVQGLDKPAEREVGRGTLQADGTITREPMSGTPTNFTLGNKTIALVTAAEWFRKIEALGSVVVSGVASVSTRAQLAARPTVPGTQVALTEAGREGAFIFSPAAMVNKVSADRAQGIYIAPGTDVSGASGAWVRQFKGALDVRWFGAAADFVTDDLPAFEAALAMLAPPLGGTNLRGGQINVPGGLYYCGGTLNLHNNVRLIGEGTDWGSRGSTIIRFPKNANGIVVNHGNTHGDGLGTQGIASGSTIEGITLLGGMNVDAAGNITNNNPIDNLTGHGIRIRTTGVKVRDVVCAFFAGDGVNVSAIAGSGGFTEGNANNFYLENMQSIYNRGRGYYFHGADGNAGTVVNCSAVSCAQGGFIDFSFLGNNFFGLHIRDCGVLSDFDLPTGTCTYLGLRYYVMPRQEALASTTAPGTNSAVWANMGPGGIAARPWVTGKTWVNGAPLGTDKDNANNRTVAIGVYVEEGQPPVSVYGVSTVMGGLHASIGSAGEIIGGRGGIQTGCLIAERVGGTKGTVFGNADGITDEDTIFKHNVPTTNWSLKSEVNNSGLYLSNGAVVLAKFKATGIDVPAGKYLSQDGIPLRPAEWTPNFTADGTVYLPAVEAMTISQGNAAIGTGTLAFTKSSAALPGTFGAAALPVTLEAGAWLKVAATGVTGFVATHLKRTA